MTKYDELIRLLKDHFVRYTEFEQRGKSAIRTMMQSFAQYLEAPPQTCRVGPPGMPLDSTEDHHPDDLAELRDDGRFAGSIVVSEASPHGGIARFTFYVRLDGETYVVQSGDAAPGKEFRVNALDATALVEFFDHAFGEVTELLKSQPEKLVRGASARPIGFAPWIS